MNLEDFDAEPADDVESVSTQAAIEFEQTEKFRRYRSTRDLILTPEVATAIREGWTYQEIADVLGISVSSVAKHANSEEMSVLLDREGRRVMRHLSHRKLGDEKYRDLALALGVIIDKARLLRNEPTEIVRTETESVDRLEILLFGTSQSPAGGGESGPIIEITPEPGTGSVPQLPESTEPAGQEESPGSSAGGDES